MYFPAMTALRFNSAVKAFGDRLEKRGKEEMVIIGAAMRKLLHICTGFSNRAVPSTPRCIQEPKTLDIHHSIFSVLIFN